MLFLKESINRDNYLAILVVCFVELDEIDLKILETLMRDARTPFTEVGRQLGISDATVHFRVKKMIDNSIIKRYTIEVNKTALGRSVCGFVLLNVNPSSLGEVAKHLVENERVSAIYEVHGPNDLILKIWGGDLDEIRDLMLKIRGIPNIAATELIMILKVWKERNT